MSNAPAEWPGRCVCRDATADPSTPVLRTCAHDDGESALRMTRTPVPRTYAQDDGESGAAHLRSG
jgi:hypothetical protein